MEEKFIKISQTSQNFHTIYNNYKDLMQNTTANVEI